jgi:hypothetical protein
MMSIAVVAVSIQETYSPAVSSVKSMFISSSSWPMVALTFLSPNPQVSSNPVPFVSVGTMISRRYSP